MGEIARRKKQMTEGSEGAKRDILSAFNEPDSEDELFETKSVVIGSVIPVLTTEEATRLEKQRQLRAKQWERESSNPILGHYWDDKATLDDGDKFLREYILNMGWKTRDNINVTTKTPDMADNDVLSIDSESEDEEFMERLDEFETKYNFRFEEEGGHTVSSHARRIDDSVRVKESKRKKERERKSERKEEERKQKLVELQRLKKAKKKEIEKRLREIELATGNAGGLDADNRGEYLDKDFDPERHDAEMSLLLGEDYYEQPDEEYSVDEEVENAESPNVAADAEENLWYYCDSCIRPIRPGNIGYECRDCQEEDLTICHNCKSEGCHPSGHKLKKFRVEENETPPEDWQSILFQMKKKKTKEIATGKFDELYGMEYEDLIGGDLPCRFKYTNVDSDSFGLSSEAILLKSDKELNSTVSLKKIHPYRKAHAFKRVRYHDGNRRT
jgi:protein KRI1